MSLNTYRWVMSDDQKAGVPQADYPFEAEVENPLMRFALARTWPRWDREMRQLAATCDLPGPARLAASHALDETPWWLPAPLNATPDYEKFLLRAEDARVLLQLLADLAAGGTKPLPAQVTRTSSGLEFTDFKGEKLIIPAP